MRKISYRDAIEHAACLVSDGSNPEYDRALCELIASLFGIPDVMTAERADHVRADIGIELPF